MLEIEVKPLDKLPEINTNDLEQAFVLESNTYDTISYEDFFNNHMRKNIPCILKNIGGDWEATKKWANDEKIEFDYLSNQYGNLLVTVTDCNNITHDCQPQTNMKFAEYVTYWKTDPKDKLLYLKDWHLRRCKPNDKFYTVPTLFASDWLNEYAQDKKVDDFMFVYMGPPGSWTPMHADVYNSFSWSVNVSGRKKWFLFPPGEEEKLRDKFKNVVLKFEPENFKEKNVTYYEIIQGKGDAIFVPSGWYHQVENEIDTISINHNWVNGTNILKVWESLTKILISVQKQIEELKDVDEYPTMCQSMLKNLYGMCFEDFVNLITHIGIKRVAQLDGGSNVAFNYPLGANHCAYDVTQIQELIKLIINHHTYTNKEYNISEDFIVLQDLLKYNIMN